MNTKKKISPEILAALPPCYNKETNTFDLKLEPEIALSLYAHLLFWWDNKYPGGFSVKDAYLGIPGVNSVGFDDIRIIDKNNLQNLIGNKILGGQGLRLLDLVKEVNNKKIKEKKFVWNGLDVEYFDENNVKVGCTHFTMEQIEFKYDKFIEAGFDSVEVFEINVNKKQANELIEKLREIRDGLEK